MGIGCYTRGRYIEYYDIVVEQMSHVQEVAGSNPAGYRAFFFCPLLSHASLDWCSVDDSQKFMHLTV